MAPVYGISIDALNALEDRETGARLNQQESLVRTDTAALPDGSGTVMYAQRFMNLDVWQAGVAVTILQKPLRMVGSRFP